MNNGLQKRAKILGIGSALPEKVLDNFYFEKIVDTSDEWITERSGIRTRHFAEPSELNSDFAANAALKALENANVAVEDVDVIILATCTGDRPIPSTAVTVQEKMGAKNAAAMDLNAACSGFIYGLITGNALICNGSAKRIVLIGCELLSRCIDMADRTTCVLFGDGAGAVVLGASDDETGIMGHYMQSDGSLRDLITIPAGGTEQPVSPETVEKRLHYVHMKGNETYKYAVTNLLKSAKKAIEMSGLEPSDIDLVIPHQANTRILQSVAKRLKVNYDEKFFINLDHIGNTSAASIPIALDEARRIGRISGGDKVLFVAFGGGLTWGGAVVQF